MTSYNNNTLKINKILHAFLRYIILESPYHDHRRNVSMV